AELGTDLRDLLAYTETIVHGTTVATNALLERRGARVGLLTTAGHRDVIEMREGLKDDRYNLRMAPPVPLVPRALRLGVRERLRFDGSVAVPLSPTSLEGAIRAPARGARRGGAARSPPRSARRRPGEPPPPRPRATAARRVPVALVRGPAADQGVRALLDHGGQRLRGPRARPLPREPRPQA